MFTQQVDNVSAAERERFREGVMRIHPLFGVQFRRDKALVTLREPYDFDTNTIRTKAASIKLFREFINEFRNEQFNETTIDQEGYEVKP